MATTSASSSMATTSASSSMATTSASSSMATTSASSSSSSSLRVRRLLHLRVASAVFFIVASRPPSSPKQQGVHQDPQEERVAIEARKKASQRIVESRPPSSPNEQGLDQPILPHLPLRHRLRFLLLHLLEQIRLLHRRVAIAIFAEITGTRSRSARTGSRNRNAEEGIATAATPLLPLRPITEYDPAKPEECVSASLGNPFEKA
ncbi:hypothetical protein Syun_030736 [Stephania yunnanensis]|uniref:Uncharacterized protein n=1 Tax=Stephania yunnanensis TaxID=152371 RepID=A0AAP0HCL8_9MAGN